MKSEVLNNINFTWPVTLAFVLFALLFIGVVIWVFRKGSGKHYHHMKNLPLDDASKQKKNAANDSREQVTSGEKNERNR